MTRWIVTSALILITMPVAADDHGLKLPPGFKATLVADHTIANDIYCMTLDDKGRVLVSSRGWVKRLEDTDDDGIFDKATVIVETATGAMGMCWIDGYLWLSADGGVSRYVNGPEVSGAFPDVVKQPRLSDKVRIVGDDATARYLAQGQSFYTPMDALLYPSIAPDADAATGIYFRFGEIVPGTEKMKQHPFPRIPLGSSEHGVHAIRKGPDGRIYIVAGNDAGIQKLKLSKESPVQYPEGGGILRLSKDLRQIECIAHGFRNPYDFDFTPMGDIITYDSDTERDFLLPWYSPTRMYHVAYGQHHGWRLPGYMRSLARPGYYADTVDVLASMGRGSPTGVTCYRHTQFPKHYRGGIFACDWTFGKIHYLPLTPDGSTYKTKPEVFLEPTGTDGFAPNDVCVAPDGSLYVSIGGRGTRGGVYRIEYTGGAKPVTRVPVKQKSLYLPLSEQQMPAMPGVDLAFLAKLEMARKSFERDVPAEKRLVPRVNLRFGVDYDGVFKDKPTLEPPFDLFSPVNERKPMPTGDNTKRPHALSNAQMKEMVRNIVSAPQPLDAWSRSQCEDLIKHMDYPCNQFFADVITGSDCTTEQRIRAIEILVALYDGLTRHDANMASDSNVAVIRERAFWAQRVDPSIAYFDDETVAKLVKDPDPRLRAMVIDVLAELINWESLGSSRRKKLLESSIPAINDPDKRVRLAAARLIRGTRNDEWYDLMLKIDRMNIGTRLAMAIASHAMLIPSRKVNVAWSALQTNDRHVQVDALRLLMLTDGDWCLHNPPEEVFSAYSLQKSRPSLAASDSLIRHRLHQIYPTGDAIFDHECARYFAMIEDDDPGTVRKIIARFTPTSTGTDDIHHLIVLARLKGKATEEQTHVVIDALFGLDKKLAGQQSRIKQNWGPRLSEIVLHLLLRYPKMTERMINHPGFVNASHVPYTVNFAPEDRQRAARLFLKAATTDANFNWSADLIDMLPVLPAAEYRPAFRTQWADYSLRDTMLRHLYEVPEEGDRVRFLDGLDSANRGIVTDCIAALMALPRDADADRLLPVFRRLRLSLHEPRETDVRAKLLALVARQTGTAPAIREDGKEFQFLNNAYAPVFGWFDTNHPAQAKLLRGDDDDAATWKQTLGTVKWDAGNAERGLKIFRERGCMACHTGSTRIGPDLVGAAGRFSRGDLWTAIISPSRDVAPAYRVNEIETQNGQTFRGIVVFESADGVIVQIDAVKTVRIDNTSIASRQPGRTSLMPAGLMKDLKPPDLADLDAYLRTLK